MLTLVRRVLACMRACQGAVNKHYAMVAHMQEELEEQKQRHVLRLKMLENPQLAAQTAAAAAAPKGTTGSARATAASTEAVPSAANGKAAGRGAAAAAATAAKQEDSGSGMFDDVDDKYEPDVTSFQKRKADKAAAKVRLKMLAATAGLALHAWTARDPCT